MAKKKPVIKAKANKPKTPRFEVFQDAKGEWRWHLRAVNGRILACSGEGFKEQRKCKKSVTLLIEAVGRAVAEQLPIVFLPTVPTEAK